MLSGLRCGLWQALRLAGVVAADGNAWTGGTTSVVQLGDLVTDANPSDLRLLEYAQRLQMAAAKEGGSLRAVLGDHDIARHALFLSRYPAVTRTL